MRKIVIPEDFADDRMMRNLLSQWRILHLKVKECEKREYWYKKHTRRKPSEIEKARRQQKWEHIARILEIENNVLKYCAKRTHHRDIWTRPKAGSPWSRRMTLIKSYTDNRRTSRRVNNGYYDKKKKRHYSSTEYRKLLRTAREETIAAIRMLEREWMVACMTTVFPGLWIPKPIVMHPSELRPRKIMRAIQYLTQEVA